MIPRDRSIGTGTSNDGWFEVSHETTSEEESEDGCNERPIPRTTSRSRSKPSSSKKKEKQQSVTSSKKKEQDLIEGDPATKTSGIDTETIVSAVSFLGIIFIAMILSEPAVITVRTVLGSDSQPSGIISRSYFRDDSFRSLLEKTMDFCVLADLETKPLFRINAAPSLTPNLVDWDSFEYIAMEQGFDCRSLATLAAKVGVTTTETAAKSPEDVSMKPISNLWWEFQKDIECFWSKPDLLVANSARGNENSLAWFFRNQKKPFGSTICEDPKVDQRVEEKLRSTKGTGHGPNQWERWVLVLGLVLLQFVHYIIDFTRETLKFNGQNEKNDPHSSAKEDTDQLRTDLTLESNPGIAQCTSTAETNGDNTAIARAFRIETRSVTTNTTIAPGITTNARPITKKSLSIDERKRKARDHALEFAHRDKEKLTNQGKVCGAYHTPSKQHSKNTTVQASPASTKSKKEQLEEARARARVFAQRDKEKLAGTPDSRAEKNTYRDNNSTRSGRDNSTDQILVSPNSLSKKERLRLARTRARACFPQK